MAMTISISGIEMEELLAVRQDYAQKHECLRTIDRNFTDKRLTCSCHNMVRIFLFLILDHTRSAIYYRFVDGMN